MRLTTIVSAVAVVAVGSCRGGVVERPEARPLVILPAPPGGGGTDWYGDPLPAGALARLGTIRLRQLEVTGGSQTVAFSPDGSRLASVDVGTLTLWEAASGRRLWALQVPWPASYFGGISFSPDGKTIAILYGGTIRLIDSASAQEARRLRCPPNTSLHKTAFSLDGRTLAGFAGGPVTFCNVRSGRIRGRVGDERRWPLYLAFSPDGKTAACDFDDGTVRIVRVPSGTEIRSLQAADSSVSRCAVAFSADGRTLATTGDYRRLRLWDMPAGTLRATAEVIGQWGWPVGFAEDSGAVAVLEDRVLRFRSALTGQALRQHDLAQVPAFAQPAFSPDLRTVAWCGAQAGEDRSIHLVDVASGRERLDLAGHRAPIVEARLRPDGRTAVSLVRDAVIRLWDARTGAARDTVSLTVPTAHSLGCATLSPDGKTAAVSFRFHNTADKRDDTTIHLWDIEAGREALVLRGHEQRVTSLAFFADGKKLASTGEDDTIRIWDLGSGTELQQMRCPEQRRVETPADGGAGGTVAVFAAGSTVAVSPDGRRLAAGVNYSVWGRFGDPHPGAQTDIWDLGSARKSHTLAPTWPCVQVCFSADGRLVATGGRNWVQVFDLGKPSAPPVRQLVGGRFAFSADGGRMAIGGPDRIQILQVETWEVLKELVTPSAVTSLAFSADGQRLVSGHADSTALVWDVAANRTAAPGKLVARPGDGGR